ncbi:hypothetical protein R1sor_012443 [Riccia sorocarpa]|uniref:DUF4005 domain-containing protein n=1 Tax=Riccia sorocarpa TaxID=122646 RepID=A0ABD3I7U4_9MARC
MGASSKWLKTLISVKKSKLSDKEGHELSPLEQFAEKEKPSTNPRRILSKISANFKSYSEGKDVRGSFQKKASRRWSLWRTSTDEYRDVEEASDCEDEAEEEEEERIVPVEPEVVVVEDDPTPVKVAAAVFRLKNSPVALQLLKEEIAATRIQTAFRAFLARRALKALKGLVRLQALARGHAVRRQAAITLRCMQALVRVQARVRARRVRMSTEGQAVRRKIDQHRRREAARRAAEEGWCGTTGSVEEIQSKLEQKQIGAIKRERAMAYAFSHQWRASSRPQPVYFNEAGEDNRHWGWSWMERWMAARPWEHRTPVSVSNRDPAESVDGRRSVHDDLSSVDIHRDRSDKSERGLKPWASRPGTSSYRTSPSNTAVPCTGPTVSRGYSNLGSQVSLRMGSYHSYDQLSDREDSLASSTPRSAPSLATQANATAVAATAGEAVPLSTQHSSGAASQTCRNQSRMSFSGTAEDRPAARNAELLSLKKERERDKLILREEAAREALRDERAERGRRVTPYMMQSGKRSYMAATKCAQAKSRSHSTPRQRPSFDENSQVTRKRSANSTPLADWNKNTQQQQVLSRSCAAPTTGPVEKLNSSGKSMRVSSAPATDPHNTLSARSILRSYSNNGSSGRPTMKSADFSSLSYGGSRTFR